MCGSGHFRVIVFSITTEEKGKVILFPFRLLLAGRGGVRFMAFEQCPSWSTCWWIGGLQDWGEIMVPHDVHQISIMSKVAALLICGHMMSDSFCFPFFFKKVYFSHNTQLKLESKSNWSRLHPRQRHEFVQMQIRQSWRSSQVMQNYAIEKKEKKKRKKKKAWTSCVLFEALQILWRYAADPIHSRCMPSSHTVSKAEEIIWWSVAWSTTSVSTPRDSYSEGTLLISPSACRWIPPMSTNFNEFSWTRIAFSFIQTVYSNQCSAFVLCFKKMHAWNYY